MKPINSKQSCINKNKDLLICFNLDKRVKGADQFSKAVVTRPAHSAKNWSLDVTNHAATHFIWTEFSNDSRIRLKIYSLSDTWRIYTEVKLESTCSSEAKDVFYKTLATDLPQITSATAIASEQAGTVAPSLKLTAFVSAPNSGVVVKTNSERSVAAVEDTNQTTMASARMFPNRAVICLLLLLLLFIYLIYAVA